ncbi:MAG TPA: DOMON-like domain-containing protein [Steroidobacteraceae bacterium]|nr:DOMON-like domain-containing protein [Steroidobacteraceae bacterium]
MAEIDAAPWPLLPHPQAPGEAARQVAARADLAPPVLLRLRYVLEADPRRVRIPAPVAGGGRADGLWAHTCFEAFIGLDESPSYLELNFSPSGQWAAYRFESYRQGMAPAALEEPPRLTVRRDGERLELEAEVRLAGALPGTPRSTRSAAAGNWRARIALSTVVEDQEGGLSYWALRHPPGRPDFHHPDCFSLALEFSRKA